MTADSIFEFNFPTPPLGEEASQGVNDGIVRYGLD